MVGDARREQGVGLSRWYMRKLGQEFCSCSTLLLRAVEDMESRSTTLTSRTSRFHLF